MRAITVTFKFYRRFHGKHINRKIEVTDTTTFKTKTIFFIIKKCLFTGKATCNANGYYR